jgi:TolA-binding protein
VPPARPRTTLPGPAEAPPPASDADLVARAEAEGIDHVLASATPSALIELADAARYTRRFSLARRSLTTLRARFPGSPAAADAAFALGVLSEDVDGDARGALGWYDRCLRDAPNGRYASECLGRKLVATRRLAGDAAAVDVAREYLRRFPGGSYVAVARTLAARGE